MEHKAALDELFAELLALLEQAGLVSLEQVMHDGTKIRAQAGADWFRREKTLRERSGGGAGSGGADGGSAGGSPRQESQAGGAGAGGAGNGRNAWKRRWRS